MTKSTTSRSVFLNCPFDRGYRGMLEALVFVVYDLGLVPRCALEEDDGGELRLSKIEKIIEQCQYGIHDLSAVTLDQVTNLPRFNMPLALGLFLGCRRFGDDIHRRKKCMILDVDRYRYRYFISDISGQDIHAHDGQPGRLSSKFETGLQRRRPDVACPVVPKSPTVLNVSSGTSRHSAPHCGETAKISSSSICLR